MITIHTYPAGALINCTETTRRLRLRWSGKIKISVVIKMDDFRCCIELSSDELMFLYEMCRFINEAPRSLRRKLGDDRVDIIKELSLRFEIQLKSYQLFCKNLSEV